METQVTFFSFDEELGVMIEKADGGWVCREEFEKLVSMLKFECEKQKKEVERLNEIMDEILDLEKNFDDMFL